MTELKPTQFVLILENTLGLPLDMSMPEWKARSIQAGQVKKKIAKNPRLYSWDNLLVAVEWCREHKKEIKQAAGIFHFVEQALKERADSGALTDSLSRRVDAAIEREKSLGDPDGFVSRLTRASGPVRGEVLAELQQIRGSE